MSKDFWDVIAEQVRELRTAKTADDVLRILSQERNPLGPGVSSADGFFAGSGGDDDMYSALREAGWKELWIRAWYWYALEAPDGSVITYIEGDVFKGNRPPI